MSLGSCHQLLLQQEIQSVNWRHHPSFTQCEAVRPSPLWQVFRKHILFFTACFAVKNVNSLECVTSNAIAGVIELV
jgi:hypothetical protein